MRVEVVRVVEPKSTNKLEAHNMQKPAYASHDARNLPKTHRSHTKQMVRNASTLNHSFRKEWFWHDKQLHVVNLSFTYLIILNFYLYQTRQYKVFRQVMSSNNCDSTILLEGLWSSSTMEESSRKDLGSPIAQLGLWANRKRELIVENLVRNPEFILVPRPARGTLLHNLYLWVFSTASPTSDR